jgi:ATP synthase protein I
MADEDRHSDADRRARAAERFRMLRQSSVGLEVALAVIVGFFVGHWLDERFDTAPVLMLVFIVLGTASGMLNLYRGAKRAMREQEQQDRDAAGGFSSNERDGSKVPERSKRRTGGD